MFKLAEHFLLDRCCFDNIAFSAKSNRAGTNCIVLSKVVDKLR